jgi:RNA polymerase sigma factor (sigma-70 family)
VGGDRPDSDGELLRRGLQGDRRAWDELVARHDRVLWRVARSYRLGEDAQDVVQDAWLQLVVHGHRLRDADAVRGWLTITVRNACLRRLQHRSRERLCCPQWEWDQLATVPAVDSPEERIVEDEARAAELAIVRCAKASLPARQQRLLELLHDPEVDGYREVGTRLNMPVGSIGPTRQRTLRRLRKRAVELGLEVKAS